MTERLELPQAVKTWLARRAAASAHVVPLAGDASSRRYLRVRQSDGASLVLAVYPEPFEFDRQPFVLTTALFTTMGVRVPAIVGHADDLGILELEDLGDVSLQAFVATGDEAGRRAFYEDAVGLIERVQRRGLELEDPRWPAYRLVFDVEKLTWELDFFAQHFLEAYRGATRTPARRAALREEFVRLAEELASEPRVLCHRDFHSRNLMVHDGQLVVIDHQDARLGPDTYDLVSLLRDAYVAVSEPEVEALIGRFLRLQPAAVEPDEFRRRFDVMAVQRTLKALGTFGFQAAALGNPVYTAYMARTLSLVRLSLTRHRRFGRLRELLAIDVPELR